MRELLHSDPEWRKVKENHPEDSLLHETIEKMLVGDHQNRISFREAYNALQNHSA